MNEAVLVLIGTAIGALAGLLPKLVEMLTSSKREKQEQAARLRMMLAGVLMSCVESTNKFLDQYTLLKLARDTEGETVKSDDLHECINLAFAMKTSWMYALISFGDSAKDEKLDKKLRDDRPKIIDDLVNKLNHTYDMHQSVAVTPDRVLRQLQEVAKVSREALDKLIRQPPNP